MSGAATFACLSLLGSTLVRPLVAVLGAPIGRLGVAGALARQNAARAPRRTASTAIALTVGLALVVAMTVVATSMKASVSDVLDRANPADLILKADSQLAAGIPTAAATRLRTLPEVGVVSPMRFAQTGDQRLRLVGTYTDTTLLGAGYLVGIGTFAANVSENLDIAVLVTAADGIGVAALKQAVRTALADYPNVAVQDTQEFNDSQGRSVDQLLGLVNVLLALAVLIALLGVVNTLALSVLERTRELGLLRAVGMTADRCTAPSGGRRSSSPRSAPSSASPWGSRSGQRRRGRWPVRGSPCCGYRSGNRCCTPCWRRRPGFSRPSCRPVGRPGWTSCAPS
jgi:putative ABC transport system permease protein